MERFDKQCCFHTDLCNYLLVNCKSFRNVETFCCSGWICLHEKSALYTLTSNNMSQITYVSINISTSCFRSVLCTLHSLQSSVRLEGVKREVETIRWIAEYGIPSHVLIGICIWCTVTLVCKFFSSLPTDPSDSNAPRYVTVLRWMLRIFAYLMVFLVSLVWNHPEAIHQNSANEMLIILVYLITGSQTKIIPCSHWKIKTFLW
jgi:hypothetical protein